MIERAEKIADGRTPMKKARFLKVTGTTKELDQAIIDRAHQLAELKGYVTNLPIETMDGAAVTGAYHDLWHIEESFRMTQVRPARTPGLPPPTRGHRSAPNRRVQSPGSQPPPARSNRGNHQEDRPNPTHHTISNHQDQQPTTHPRTRTHHRSPRHPQPT
jgi:hypothetical protein